MPRPKRPFVVTEAPAHSEAANAEQAEGIEHFLEWASRARTGETSEPAARAADQALTAFSEGRFNGALIDVALWAVLACNNIRNRVQKAHWHLCPCPVCHRWLLAKDQRRALCRRIECVRAVKKSQRASQRKLRGELDDGARRRTF